MPLLLCPNDNSAMQTVQRAGVEFDMCPTCRGVWLDRGELEKLMSSEGGQPTPAPRSPDVRQPHGFDRPRHDDDHRGGYRKKQSIFDIFD